MYLAIYVMAGLVFGLSMPINRPFFIQHQSEEPETSDWTVAPEGALTMTVAGCSKLTFVGAQLCVGSPSSLNIKDTVTLCGSLFPEGEQNRQYFKAFTADSPKIRLAWSRMSMSPGTPFEPT